MAHLTDIKSLLKQLLPKMEAEVDMLCLLSQPKEEQQQI